MSSLRECYGSPHEFFEKVAEYARELLPECKVVFNKDGNTDPKKYVYFWINVVIPKGVNISVNEAKARLKSLKKDTAHKYVKRDWNMYCKFSVYKEW